MAPPARVDHAEMSLGKSPRAGPVCLRASRKAVVICVDRTGNQVVPFLYEPMVWRGWAPHI